MILVVVIIVPNLTNIPPGIAIHLIENKNILLSLKINVFLKIRVNGLDNSLTSLIKSYNK